MALPFSSTSTSREKSAASTSARYARNFADLLTAEDRAGRQELKSKAILVGGSNIVCPGLTVIQRTEPFDLQQLEPFLAPLRAVPDLRGGAADAG